MFLSLLPPRLTRGAQEFTRCDPAVWQEVVIPLLGVNGTSIVAISTPLGEDNWYLELIQSRMDDGSQLFNVIQYSLVCPYVFLATF